MGESVNIKEYLDMFRRRKWIIILVMLVCLGFGGYRTYTNYVSYLPTYKATVKIKINSMKEYNEAVEKSKSKKSPGKKLAVAKPCIFAQQSAGHAANAAQNLKQPRDAPHGQCRGV